MEKIEYRNMTLNQKLKQIDYNISLDIAKTIDAKIKGQEDTVK